MPTDDNVVKIPDRLERRAQKIEAALRRRGNAKTEWKEATLDLAIELAGARADLPSDQAFGKWCDDRFRNATIPKDERAILIRWGNDPDQARAILEKTDSQSIQMIDRRFRADAKPAEQTESQSYGGPKRERAVDAILAYEAEHGELPTAIWGGTVPGVTPSTYYHTLREIKSIRAHADTAWPLRFTKAQERHIEALVKLKAKEFEKDFEDRVVEETKKRIDVLFPKLEKLEESAKTNEKYYRERLESLAIFSEAEYRDILLCTHEANPSKETRERAFITLNAKKLQLTGRK
jgi:hypothetical protein